MISFVTYLDPQPDEGTKLRTNVVFDGVTKQSDETWQDDQRDRLEDWEKNNCISLINKGVSLNAYDSNNQTLQTWAAIQGHREIFDALLAQGGDINAKRKHGLTYLYLAAHNGNTKTVDHLLNRGADIEARNDTGDTVLHTSTHWRLNTDTVEALLAKGANMWAANGACHTALDVAKEKGNTDTAATLEFHAKECTALYDDFIMHRTPPTSAEQVYKLLSVWPLLDPTAYVDRTANLRQMFRHAKWESPAQVADVILELREAGENAALCASLQAVSRPSPAQAMSMGRNR